MYSDQTAPSIQARAGETAVPFAPTNIRSQKATAKLGAKHAYDADLDLSGTPAHWMCFRLQKQDWDAICAEKQQNTTYVI